MGSKAHMISLLPFYVLISFLCLPHTTLADSEISDAKKKEAVYRLYDGYKKDFPAIKDSSPLLAMKHLKQGKVVFVDTRRPAEMAVSMLPGSYFLCNKGAYSPMMTPFQSRIAIWKISLYE